MQRQKSILSNALISLAIKLGGSGLLLIVSIYISRSLGARDFGLFSLFMSMLLPLSMVCRLGLENNLMRLISKENVSASAARSLFQETALIVLYASFTLAIILWGIDLFLPPGGRAETFNAILPWLALSLPFHALLFSLIYYFRGRHRIVTSMLFENIVLYLIFLVWLVLTSKPSVPLGMGLSIAITFLLAFIFYPSMGSCGSDKQEQCLPTTSERLLESFPMLMTSLSTIAFVTVDIFLLSLFLESADVGIYAAAAKLVSFINFPLIAIIGMIAPKLSALDDMNNRSALHAVFRQSTGFAFWGSLPIIVAIVLFPDQLLGLFGEGFEQAKGVIFILLLGHVATIMLGPIGYLLWMTGYASELQRVTLLSLCTTIALCLILIPVLGINGSAIAITTGLLIKNLGSWKLVSTHLKFNPLYLPWDGILHALYRKH